jgi:hypothetical protein
MFDGLLACQPTVHTEHSIAAAVAVASKHLEQELLCSSKKYVKALSIKSGMLLLTLAPMTSPHDNTWTVSQADSMLKSVFNSRSTQKPQACKVPCFNWTATSSCTTQLSTCKDSAPYMLHNKA